MIGISIANSLGSRFSSGGAVIAPVAIAATGIGETSFTANWNAFAGAQYYLLDVSTSPSFSSFVLQDEVVIAPTTSYVVIGLTANTTYYYRLRASTDAYIDPDALAFFSRVTTAGGSLTLTEQQAVNQLVLDMKSYGVWSSMKAVYPMVGASAAACAQNLKSSSFTGTFSSGWTFASTGAAPNGTSAFMNSTLNPSISLSQNSTHISYYTRTNVNSNTYEIGARSSFFLDLAIRYGGTTYGGVYAGESQFSDSDSLGLYQSNRIVSNEQTVWKNGVKKVTGGLTSNAPMNLSVYLGAYNNSGSASNFSIKECAFSSIGDGLTDTQSANFYTAVQTFNQTLNRSVGPQVVSDADAQAYINRVYTAGGTLTNTEANAVNQLTIDMKAAGIWTAMKAVYPMVGASAAACSQNLKSSSFTGTFTSGWTFASTGATPNGTSAYMDTAFIASTNLTKGSGHLSYYSRTQTDVGLAGNASTMGNNDGGRGRIVLRRPDNSCYMECGTNGADSRTYTTTDSRCFAIANVISNQNVDYFRNGIKQTASAVNTTGQGWATGVMTIGSGWVSAGQYDNKQCAFASIGDGLTDTQALNFDTAVQAFQTTLSRQV